MAISNKFFLFNKNKSLGGFRGTVFINGETDTPPTLAPVLTVEPYGEYLVGLFWSQSDKLDSDGFGYRLEFDVESSGWTTRQTFGPASIDYEDDLSTVGFGTYLFRIVPFNDAGDGPPSNVVEQSLPVEAFVAWEDGEALQWEDGEPMTW